MQGNSHPSLKVVRYIITFVTNYLTKQEKESKETKAIRPFVPTPIQLVFFIDIICHLDCVPLLNLNSISLRFLIDDFLMLSPGNFGFTVFKLLFFFN